ncbi:hypothetical protein LDENG_00269700, partial [Lucifuga dentata]
MVPCLRAVAATTAAVLSYLHDIVNIPMTVHVPHAVHALMLQAKNGSSGSSVLRLSTLTECFIKLRTCHVTLKRYTVLNPATLCCPQMMMESL